jgi:hypothetical protein
VFAPTQSEQNTAALRQALQQPSGDCGTPCITLADAASTATALLGCLDTNQALRAVPLTAKGLDPTRSAWSAFSTALASGATTIEALGRVQATDANGALDALAAQIAAQAWLNATTPVLMPPPSSASVLATIYLANTAVECEDRVRAIGQRYRDCNAAHVRNKCPLYTAPFVLTADDPCQALGHWKLDCGTSSCNPDQEPSTFFVNIYPGDLHAGSGILLGGWAGSSQNGLYYPSFDEKACTVALANRSITDCDGNSNYVFGAPTLTVTDCNDYTGYNIECPLTCTVTHLEAAASSL